VSEIDPLRRRLRFRLKASAHVEEVGTLEELKSKELETIKKLKSAMDKLPAVVTVGKHGVKPIGWELYDEDQRRWVPVPQAEDDTESEDEESSPGDGEV
jgi:hypothetical protein